MGFNNDNFCKSIVEDMCKNNTSIQNLCTKLNIEENIQQCEQWKTQQDPQELEATLVLLVKNHITDQFMNSKKTDDTNTDVKQKDNKNTSISKDTKSEVSTPKPDDSYPPKIHELEKEDNSYLKELEKNDDTYLKDLEKNDDTYLKELEKNDDTYLSKLK